jgi:general stress protein 26
MQDGIDRETSSRQQLWTLIKDIRFAMFTTRAPDGTLRSAPMTLQNKAIDEDDTLWFFMQRGNDAVAGLGEPAHVNVAFADPGDDRYVSVSGLGRVVDDRAKATALWSKMSEAWFPGGPDDPKLALVEVRIVVAQYWDVKDSKLTQLYKMAKAAITGKPPRDMGDVGEVRMR